jgi:hypothetical protein
MNEAFAILPAATGIVPNKRMEVGRTPTMVAADPHSARLALDHVEWGDLRHLGGLQSSIECRLGISLVIRLAREKTVNWQANNRYLWTGVTFAA